MSEQQQEEVRVELDQLMEAARFIARSQREPVKAKEPTWVDSVFAPPKTLSEFLGRLTWSLLIPAIATLIYLPIAQWLWWNQFPMVVLIVTACILVGYWLAYQSAVKTAASRILVDAVNFWMALPPAVVFFCVVYQVLKP